MSERFFTKRAAQREADALNKIVRAARSSGGKKIDYIVTQTKKFGRRFEVQSRGSRIYSSSRSADV